MLISISKYMLLTAYFLFIHYLLIIIAFSLFFKFEIETQTYPALKTKTIDFLLQKNIVSKKNTYDYFFKKKIIYSITATPLLQINDLLFFKNEKIAIPLIYFLKKQKNVPHCTTHLRYDEIDVSLLKETAGIIVAAKNLFLTAPEVRIENKKKIILEDREKIIIAYPWQEIPEELLERTQINKKNHNKVTIDIRPYYKNNYQI